MDDKEYESFFQTVIFEDCILKADVRFSVLNVDCAVFPGLALSNVIVDSCYAMTEQGLEIRTGFWRVFDRAMEVLKDRKGCSNEELAAFNNLLKTHKSIDELNLLQELGKLKSKNILESESGVWIMENIISPLLGESGQCLLNSTHDAPLRKMQRQGKGKQLFVKRGLGIGHTEAWYGELDAMVCPSEKDIPGGKVAVVEGLHEESDSGEEMDAEEDNTDVVDNEERTPGTNVIVERKRRDNHKTLIGQSYSQSIATAISFSFTYRERHETLNPLIPALQISPDVFTVLMYDCVHDYLIGIIFHWTRESLVYLWAVLHYRLFQRRSSDQLGLKRSGYASQSEQKKGFTKLKKFMYKVNIHKIYSEDLNRDMRVCVSAAASL